MRFKETLFPGPALLPCLPTFAAMSAAEEQKALELDRVRWSYRENNPGGSGLWVTFHGYGHHAGVMAGFMESLLPDAWTLNIDLPHHGDTVCDSASLHPDDLSRLVLALLRERGVQRCSILAFSLGGKAALKLVELIPGKIDRLVLIAPDGLWVNPLYRFTVNTGAGRWMYRKVTGNPRPLFASMTALRKYGLLDARVDTFVRNSLRSERQRQLVMKVWTSFRLIVPDLRKVQEYVHRYAIGTLIVVGRYDRIIRPSLAARLDDGSSKYIRTVVLERSHDLVTDEVAQELRHNLPPAPLS
jgi:pimeloyl-ACP methyl ester carboxylesterase